MATQLTKEAQQNIPTTSEVHHAENASANNVDASNITSGGRFSNLKPNTQIFGVTGMPKPVPLVSQNQSHSILEKKFQNRASPLFQPGGRGSKQLAALKLMDRSQNIDGSPSSSSPGAAEDDGMSFEIKENSWVLCAGKSPYYARVISIQSENPDNVLVQPLHKSPADASLLVPWDGHIWLAKSEHLFVVQMKQEPGGRRVVLTPQLKFILGRLARGRRGQSTYPQSMTAIRVSGRDDWDTVSLESSEKDRDESNSVDSVFINLQRAELPSHSSSSSSSSSANQNLRTETKIAPPTLEALAVNTEAAMVPLMAEVVAAKAKPEVAASTKPSQRAWMQDEWTVNANTISNSTKEGLSSATSCLMHEGTDALTNPKPILSIREMSLLSSSSSSKAVDEDAVRLVRAPATQAIAQARVRPPVPEFSSSSMADGSLSSESMGFPPRAPKGIALMAHKREKDTPDTSRTDTSMPSQEKGKEKPDVIALGDVKTKLYRKNKALYDRLFSNQNRAHPRGASSVSSLPARGYNHGFSDSPHQSPGRRSASTASPRTTPGSCSDASLVNSPYTASEGESIAYSNCSSDTRGASQNACEENSPSTMYSTDALDACMTAAAAHLDMLIPSSRRNFTKSNSKDSDSVNRCDLQLSSSCIQKPTSNYPNQTHEVRQGTGITEADKRANQLQCSAKNMPNVTDATAVAGTAATVDVTDAAMDVTGLDASFDHGLTEEGGASGCEMREIMQPIHNNDSNDGNDGGDNNDTDSVINYWDANYVMSPSPAASPQPARSSSSLSSSSSAVSSLLPSASSSEQPPLSQNEIDTDPTTVSVSTSASVLLVQEAKELEGDEVPEKLSKSNSVVEEVTSKPADDDHATASMVLLSISTDHRRDEVEDRTVQQPVTATSATTITTVTTATTVNTVTSDEDICIGSPTQNPISGQHSNKSDGDEGDSRVSETTKKRRRSPGVSTCSLHHCSPKAPVPPAQQQQQQQQGKFKSSRSGKSSVDSDEIVANNSDPSSLEEVRSVTVSGETKKKNRKRKQEHVISSSETQESKSKKKVSPSSLSSFSSSSSSRCKKLSFPRSGSEGKTQQQRLKRIGRGYNKVGDNIDSEGIADECEGVDWNDSMGNRRYIERQDKVKQSKSRTNSNSNSSSSIRGKESRSNSCASSMSSNDKKDKGNRDNNRRKSDSSLSSSSAGTGTVTGTVTKGSSSSRSTVTEAVSQAAEDDVTAGGAGNGARPSRRNAGLSYADRWAFLGASWATRTQAASTGSWKLN